VRELPRQLSEDELAGLFEGRTGLVRRLAFEPDPLTRAVTLVHELPHDEKVEMLAAHPAIGQRKGLSTRSAAEQGGDADPKVLAELERLNADYEARHGFRFVVFVNRRPKAEIVPILRERLEATREDELDTALAELVGRIEALAPSLEQFLGYVWRRHLLAALRRRSAKPSAADRTLTIGFADLVGFTAMSQALDPRELAAMVDRFEAIAYEHIPERGGRVVKMIGDEVMFAVDDGAFAADIAVALVEALARDPALPGVRVGLASGPTLSWEGDLYGPTVNLASRLVNFARPNSVLISDELGEQLRDDPRFELRRLRPVNLQGIGRMRLWVLRRARVA
jgi:class 3 adenylate cyclase